MTEKRQAALRQAQISAAWARKRDRSVFYAPGFLHGRQVADPSRALPLSSATQAEYQAHLAINDIGLQPVTERQDKLARATGMVSWKWLTAMRLYGDTEVLGVWECLDRVAAERRAGLGLTPKRLMEFIRELDRVFERWFGWDDEIAPLDHRLMQLLRQGIVERGAPKPRIKSLRPSRTVENFEEHSAEELATPGCGSQRVKARLAAEPALRAERPAVRPEAGGVSGGDAAPAGAGGIGGAGAKETPLPAPGPTGKAAAGRVVVEESAKQAAAFRTPGSVGSGVRPFRTPLEEEAEARRELDREKREFEQHLYAAVRRARQAGVALPGDYGEFVRRVEAALGATVPATGGPAQAFCSAGVPAGKATNLERRSPACAEDRPRGGDTAQTDGPLPPGVIPSALAERGAEEGIQKASASGNVPSLGSVPPSGPTPRAAADRDAELVAEIAAALWQRLTVFRRYAAKLERALTLHLLEAADNLHLPYDRAGSDYATEVAWEVVAHDFGHFQARAARAASAAEKRLAAGFYALSVERWGRTAECASLAEEGLRDLNERYWAWRVTHPKPGEEMPHLDFSDTADPFLRAIELLREAGVDVGKTIPSGYEPS